MGKERLHVWQSDMDEAVKRGSEKKIAALNLLKEFVGSKVTLKPVTKENVNDPVYWEFEYAFDLGLLQRGEGEAGYADWWKKNNPEAMTAALKEKMYSLALEVYDIGPSMEMFGGAGVKLAATADGEHFTVQWSNDFLGIPDELVHKWLVALYGGN